MDVDLHIRPVVHTRDRLPHLQRQESCEVVRATAVAPRLDVTRLDLAFLGHSHLVLGFEAMTSSHRLLLQGCFESHLHSLLQLVGSHRGHGGHWHLAAVLGPEGTPGTALLAHHKGARHTQHARQLGTGKVVALRGVPDGHALLLLGNCQSSLLLQREGVLPNDVGSAFEDKVAGFEAGVHVALVDHVFEVGSLQEGSCFDRLVQGDNGAFVGAGDLHLHQTSSLLGSSVGVRHHQGQLLARGHDAPANLDKYRLFAWNKASAILSRNVHSSDDVHDTLHLESFRHVQTLELAGGCFTQHWVAEERGDGLVICVTH
mmetsp:Transcript_13294/g.31545  ORF Transcript_13294/g.31545 Transcript_13294/m.31545 type:complete len:316 (+) Transcript_13294:1436-2383(+)